MSATERLTERGDKAGIFLTLQLHLPPWSSIGERKVINTVAATIQQTKAISPSVEVGSWVEPRENTLVPFLGTGVFFIL